MAPKVPVERIRLEDILLPVAPSSINHNSRRRNQTARKSTGRLPPRKMLGMDSSSTSRSSSPGPSRKSQSARKSTGGMPPRPMVSSQMTVEKMPIRSKHHSFRNSPIPHRRRTVDGTDSDESGNSRAGSSDPSSLDRRRTSQTSRKSTGGGVSQRRSDESAHSSSSPDNAPPPIISAHDPGRITPCGLCPLPLQIAPTPYSIVDPSQPIHGLLAICQHHFHYACYMRYLTTAPSNSRACCPKCYANLLTNEQYWFHVTTTTGNQCYSDITKEVEERFLAVGLARKQIFLDCLGFRNHHLAASLLEGPDAVDVNFRTSIGGWTPLHFCARHNDVAGIDFLLSRGANKHQKADDGSLAIDYAKFNNALNAVERLA